jgi:putative exosortase-associated protein (TIGR04073 family)
MAMRNSLSLLFVVAGTALLGVGCAGPEAKLGRGFNNLTEFARMGEMRRSVEQSTLWEGPDVGSSKGVVRGFNRSIARTFVGLYEVVTFPLPDYDPLYKPVNPVYPDSYKPGRFADQLFATDSSLGFSGGDVAPMIPGSRFKIFDE